MPNSSSSDQSGSSAAGSGTQPLSSHGLLNPDTFCERPIFMEIGLNEQLLRGVFTRCSDIVFRTFTIFGARKALLLYVDGLIDSKELEENILKPLTTAEGSTMYGQQSTIAFLQEVVLPIGSTETVDTLPRVVNMVLRWQGLLLIDGETKALALSVSGWPQRAVAEPQTEAVIRGPREAFTENVRTSTALIRRRIHTPDLKMESMQIGRYTQTQVVLCYIENLASPNLIKEVKERLSRIEIDAVLESGYIEELI
ncbi:MAG: spore germination protein, partial [Firmicutes bacterium]|nr:spore germination protein [Bacillota bacterium]